MVGAHGSAMQDAVAAALSCQSSVPGVEHPALLCEVASTIQNFLCKDVAWPTERHV